MACHIPAACVRVWTMTDRFTSQSTNSVPSAHFRINLPDTCNPMKNGKLITLLFTFVFDLQHQSDAHCELKWWYSSSQYIREHDPLDAYLSVFETTCAVGQQEYTQRPSDTRNGRTRCFGDGKCRIRMIWTVWTSYRWCGDRWRNATTKTCTTFKQIQLVAAHIICIIGKSTKNGFAQKWFPLTQNE